MPAQSRTGLVVLISGLGRNLQAIIDARLDVDLRAVISNRSNAPGLDFARAAGIPTHVLPSVKSVDRAQYDRELAALIEQFSPDVVALAGFMRILSSAFVQQFAGRLVNIHPSLLPRYRGLDTHRKVLAAGDTRHGASVHFVTEDLDAGPVLLQGSMAVATGETPGGLADKLMRNVETRIYPQALEWIAQGRAQLRDGRIEFDGKPLEAPLHEDFYEDTAQ